METQKTALAIKDLIIINNDRYYGYKTAVSETKDEDLKSLFTQFSNQSKTFSVQLRKFIPADETGINDNETKNSGKLFRLWMDFRSAITDHDRKAILRSCEFGEYAAKRTYDEVLEYKQDIPAEAMSLIRRQREELQKGHDQVKSMRQAIE
ncbi:MAG TPA: PA2169 family four-helix-bundle protein [Bacteroidia bacterium]|nr:PA2169 family four-helix-bundle protein [Bacteroidia bacterium]